MPNWVHNQLKITGSKEAIEKVKTQLSKPYRREIDGTVYECDDVISFWNVVEPTGEALETYGSAGWYDWNVENWGTKWDCSETVMEDYSSGEVAYMFNTAWSPPTPIASTLSKQHPDVEITLSYEEEQGWGGTVQAINGEVEELEFYDIPNSHAEKVERSDYCCCEDDPDYAPFDDCPTFNAIIPEDEILLEQVR